MESSSAVVLNEHTTSHVSKKCIQEVSATKVQKLSSSALVGEKSMSSILESDGSLIGNQMAPDGMMMTALPASPSSLSMSSPIITSLTLLEDGNAVNTSSQQSEFSAMTLKDEHDNEIGKIVQGKQQQQCIKASSSVKSVDGGSKSTSSASQISSSTTSSSMVQQSASSLVAEAQESSSSVFCSSFISTKKKETVSSNTRSLSSIKTSQAIETVMKSSTAVAQDQEF